MRGSASPIPVAASRANAAAISVQGQPLYSSSSLNNASLPMMDAGGPLLLPAY